MVRVISNVARRYAAVIEKATLEQWKQNLKVMTKIYRDIPVVVAYEDDQAMKKAQEQADEARNLFVKFRNNFETWVYKVVLPKPDRKGGESPIEKAVMKSTWDFRYTLDTSFLFPRSSGSNINISEMKDARDKAIKRYQVAATKAFKDLEEYIASKGGTLQRRNQVETFEVSGVPVIVENWGRDEESETEQDLHVALNQLKKRLDRINGSGFATAIRGLTLTIDFDQKEALTNGMYNYATDTLTLFPLGLAGEGAGEGTLTHEIGHRFYFRDLPGQAKAHWEEVLDAKGIRITKEDIHRFAQLVRQKIDPENPKKLNDSSTLLKEVLPAAKDESDELRFKELARLSVVPWDATSFDFDWYLDFLMSSEGEIVHVEEISEYGNTSPVEAFAECFRLWVLKGPGALGPWTRQFFRDICRAGGAKLAGESHV